MARDDGVVAYALGLLGSQTMPATDIRDDIEVFGVGFLMVTRDEAGEFKVKVLKPEQVVILNGQA